MVFSQREGPIKQARVQEKRCEKLKGDSMLLEKTEREKVKRPRWRTKEGPNHDFLKGNVLMQQLVFKMEIALQKHEPGDKEHR